MNIDTQNLILKDINNTTFNFKKLFKITNSITWINCNNLKVVIDSPVNKLILKKCKNIELTLDKTIAGIEINRCVNLIINTKQGKHLNHLDIFKSSVTLNISKQDLDIINIVKAKSELNINN